MADPTTDEGSARRRRLLEDVLGEGVEIVAAEDGRGPVEVFRCREVELGREVELKVLSPGARQHTARGRFEREARAVASLRGPGVPALLRFGRLGDGSPWMVTERIEGVPLDRLLREGGPLPEAEARRALREVAEVLAEAHRKGIVHRGVRPSSIVRETRTGRWVLTDFGVAALVGERGEGAERLTRPGELLGDPRRSSPEQLRGEEASPKADVYSLGVLGYELLTGGGPFGELTNREAIRAHLEREPEGLPPGTTAPPLARALRRALAKDPASRPDAAALALAAAGEPSGGGTGDEWMKGALRRRIPQAVLIIGAAGWVALQVVDQLVQNAILPGVAYPLALAGAVAALAVAAIAAWFHGERGRQRVRPLEVALLLAVLVSLVAVCVWIVVA